MNSSLRKLSGYFLLLAFLFPLVQKGIHDFGHRLDFHCEEKSDKHFHEQEHTCAACDYQVPASGDLSFSSDCILIPAKPFSPVDFTIAEFPSAFFHRTLSRGPPALS
jgi:hypothetical protein